MKNTGNSSNSITIDHITNAETVIIMNTDKSTSIFTIDQLPSIVTVETGNPGNNTSNNTIYNVTNTETAIVPLKTPRPYPFCKLLGYYQFVCRSVYNKYHEKPLARHD